MSAQGIKVVFGAAALGNSGPWTSPEYVEKAFQIMLANDCNVLDSAQLYGESEKFIGQLKAGEKFVSPPYLSLRVSRRATRSSKSMRSSFCSSDTA